MAPTSITPPIIKTHLAIVNVQFATECAASFAPNINKITIITKAVTKSLVMVFKLFQQMILRLFAF